MHPDAKNVGAHLDETVSHVRDLLGRARQLAEIDAAVRTWAQEPLSGSLRVANMHNGVLIVFIENAAAYTALRYRQQELMEALRQRFGMTIDKIEIKTMPNVRSGRPDRV